MQTILRYNNKLVALSNSYLEWIEPAAPTWTNLIAWYSFDETSGNLLDLYGDDDGVLTGCTQGETGKIGTAYSFNGSPDLIILDTGYTVGTGTFTFAGWVYPTSDGGGIMGGGAGAFEIVLYTDGEYQNRRPRVMEGAGTGSGVASLVLTDSDWNFLTVVRDGTNFRFGVNGSYENETGTFDFNTPSNIIGGNSAYGYFAGKLDEFAYFSDAKSDAYLTAMYNSGNGKAYADGE